MKSKKISNSLVVLSLILAQVVWFVNPAKVAASGSWHSTGNMSVPRYCFTTTLLDDGTLLAVGGHPDATSAEVYDPITGTWAPTGSMAVGHNSHTATRLLDGRVLIAGGHDATSDGRATVYTEIYDPSTGTFSLTGSMHQARADHTAVLLPDGKVLVVGGRTPHGYIAISSAEIYDPATGTWSLTGSLAQARMFHAAVLLTDGRVLVVGGSEPHWNGSSHDWTDFASAEVYDPAAGTWSFTGSMADTRSAPSLVRLLDDKVLVAGGVHQPPVGYESLASAELYDHTTGTWSPTGSMHIARGSDEAIALLPSGKVVVTGGMDDSELSATASAELYDPASAIWTLESSMSVPRYGHTLTALQDGRVMAIGGSNDGTPSRIFYDSAEWFFDTSLFVDSGQNLGDSESTGIALGDIDNDGDIDAVVANELGEPNKVWLNQGDGVFEEGQSLGSAISRAAALGDLDDDGDLDIFFANVGPNEVWLNDGSGSFTDSGQRLGDSCSYGMALGDLDGDGDLDVFIANGILGGQANKVWLNDGTGEFTPGQELGNAYSHGVALGDVDGDGDLDAFIANWSDPNKVWENDGTANFGEKQSMDATWSIGVTLGDLDNDGDPDAFTANYGSNRVWRNDGGTFADSNQMLGASYSFRVALGDLDGDGDLDAFVANLNNSDREPNTVWRNDEGVFTELQRVGNARSANVAIGDVDGDGDLDAFIANANPSASNKVWLNTSINIIATADDTEVYPGDLVTVELGGENAWLLYGPQVECYADGNVLAIQDGAIGDLFSTPLVGIDYVDPVENTWFGGYSQQKGEPFFGDGRAATLTYVAVNPGITSITCDVLLSDRDGFRLPTSFVGAEVTVLPYAGIEGQVTQQGREGNHSNIEIKAEGPFTYTTSTVETGGFAFTQVRAAAGQTTAVYAVTADVSQYLPSCESVEVTLGATTTLSPAVLRGGDTNDDDVINIGDAALIADNFGLPASEADPRANINDDDAVNVQDLAILGGNYELAGCQPWQ